MRNSRAGAADPFCCAFTAFPRSVVLVYGCEEYVGIRGAEKGMKTLVSVPFWGKSDPVDTQARGIVVCRFPQRVIGRSLNEISDVSVSGTDRGSCCGDGSSASHETVKAAIEAIPVQAWRSAVDGDGEARDGAEVAELTGWMPTPTRATRPGPKDWPAGMRVIVRRERPHPGAQLRLTDSDGWRITCFATNTRGPGWTLATLAIRHRQRARAEDRIRGLKDKGMRNLPFHGFAQNQIWLEIVSLAAELLAWTQTLSWDEHEPVRRWEPKRLRLRILAVAGRIIHTGRKRLLRLPRGWPYNHLIDTAWTTLRIA